MGTNIRPVKCAGTCGLTIQVSWSSSCEGWAIYCGTCWENRP